ncbi:MAG: TerB N-terminal domain-containing protein [Oscillospiraceae bacterium]|nr:TerB N-terminal domain-containing protein [Oscillospiraceae bacterium]
MGKHSADKIYEASKIPFRQSVREAGGVEQPVLAKPLPTISPTSDVYYEIEYDSCPIPGVGKFVPKPQKIAEPEKDEIRDLFLKMREISRTHQSPSSYVKFFGRNSSRDNSYVFYRQGMFMKDFTDDYTGNAPFSHYFPYYQIMGYEQLRTYFTWRTQIREGIISETPLSYAFLYIYELLSNIGVSGPQDGLDRLMAFWRAFGAHTKIIDRYMIRWLKDYHIYYQLPRSFQEFIAENSLAAHYPSIAAPDDIFNLFCVISKYDIKRSAFFADGNATLIEDCFVYVISRLKQICTDRSIDFDRSIFQPPIKRLAWTPFRDALFYQWAPQADRRIVLSTTEIYICEQGKWTYSTAITTDGGRLLVGYIMKQMESVLRQVTQHKFKLSASISNASSPIVEELRISGKPLESIVSDATLEFYREATKTIVKVDLSALSLIRKEALATQEKLIVPEQGVQPVGAKSRTPHLTDLQNLPQAALQDILPSEPEPRPRPTPTFDSAAPAASEDAESVKSIFTESELGALCAALRGEPDIQAFADGCGVMPEVLVDGINVKAMDYIGDNLLDEDFVLYDDYKELVRGWVL